MTDESDLDLATMGSRPDWSMWRHLMRRSNRSPAGIETGLWAMDVLEKTLGSDWPGRVRRREGAVPPEVAWSSAHAAAFAELVELALRLKLLENVPGIARVRQDLRRNLEGHRRLHAGVQLEVAGLAKMAGHKVTLETPAADRKTPVDVVFRAGPIVLAVEAKVIMLDDLSRAGMAFADEVTTHLTRIQMAYDIAFDGELNRKLSPVELAEWAAILTVAAAQVAAEDEERTVIHPSGTIRLIPGRKADGAIFRGPAQSSSGWPRIATVLHAKARQGVRAGASWLRVDVRDGLWQFSSFARSDLSNKLTALADAVQQELQSVKGLDGVVVTSGACQTQGVFKAETCRQPDGRIALRRLIEPVRVRECVVLPLTPGSQLEAEEWARLYDGEPEWTDRALAECGLPSATNVFAWKP